MFSLILNYRTGKLAVTPALTLNEGATYGNPGDLIGVDPRTCTANNATIKATSGDPLHADYTSCNFAATPSGNLYIPNPASGHFDGFGEYRQPWQLNLGAQLNYAFTPKVSLNLTVAESGQHVLRRLEHAVVAAVPAEQRRLRLHRQHVLHQQLLERLGTRTTSRPTASR